jgi:hypothetical protein
VYRELENNHYTVFPIKPEEVGRDPKKIQELRGTRIDIMSGCDAVLLLGTQDTNALMADLGVVGRLDRQEAIARYNRPLPCGVVDISGLVYQEPDLPRKAKNLGVDWFDASVPPWTPKIQMWLHGAVE